MYNKLKLLLLLILVGLVTFSCTGKKINQSASEIPVFDNTNELSIQKEIADVESNQIRSESTDKLLHVGKLYYQLALKENGADYLESAQNNLEKVLANQPKNQEALAYLGSLYTLKAKYSYLPWKKLQFVDEGCKYLDQAVALDSLNTDTRIIRATNNVHLPEFFNRLKVSKKDLAYLRSRNVFSTLPPQNQSEVLYYSGMLYEKLGENDRAIKMYQRFIESSASENSHQEVILSKIEELSKQG